MALLAHGNKNTDWKSAGIPRIQGGTSLSHDLNKMTRLKPLPVAGHSSFISHMAMYFPAAVARIDESDFGVVHLEVGALKLETQDAIAKRDWDTVREHFAFLSGTLQDAGPELRNAIEVSYLGALFYGELSLNYAKARSMLPRNLADALWSVEGHYENLAF